MKKQQNKQADPRFGHKSKSQSDSANVESAASYLVTNPTPTGAIGRADFLFVPQVSPNTDTE
jgi:hypothetical protein